MNRRLKMLVVKPEAIVNLLRMLAGHHPGSIEVPALDWPEGTEIVAIVPDYFAQSIGILFTHPSFEEVDPGSHPLKINPSEEEWSTWGKLLQLRLKSDTVPDMVAASNALRDFGKAAADNLHKINNPDEESIRISNLVKKEYGENTPLHQLGKAMAEAGIRNDKSAAEMTDVLMLKAEEDANEYIGREIEQPDHSRPQGKALHIACVHCGRTQVHMENQYNNYRCPFCAMVNSDQNVVRYDNVDITKPINPVSLRDINIKGE
jgi:hypothetical protein